MDVFHTFASDPGFDIQADVDLAHGISGYAEGPDRAYLLFPYQDGAGLAGEETAGLWITEPPEAAAALASVLGIQDPQLCKARPWYVRWIRNGEIVVKQHWLGLDRGVHLIGLLSPYDLLDRHSHLFGLGEEVGA